MKEKTAVMAFRITEDLYSYIKKYLEHHPFYLNMSDFARDAIMEKVKAENPLFFKQMLENLSQSSIKKED